MSLLEKKKKENLDTETYTQKECHIDMKTKVKIICLYTKVSSKPTEVRREGRDSFSYTAKRRNQGLLSAGTSNMTNQFLGLSDSVCGTL